MTQFNKNMEDFFDVPEQPKETLPAVQEHHDVTMVESIPQVEDILDVDLDEDYSNSRATYQELVDQGTSAINQLKEIAKETEHPRAYEVLATLIKNTAEVNEKLMMMQKQIREIKGLKEGSGKVNVDKAIFVGSTAELSKLIKGKEL